MYRYFFLNIRIKEKDNEASKWISQKKVPIFFGESTIKDCLSKEVNNPQATLFCEIGSLRKDEQQNCRIVTIDDGLIHIYLPDGKLKEEKCELRESGKKVIPKTMPIKLIETVTVSKAPLVLSSMKVNQAVSRGTFFEFSNRSGAYKGNRAAVQAVTADWEDGFKVDPLDCLSSLEFETLVAKLFEEHGCFVPAYKGGYLRDVDLFVTPNETKEFCGVKLTKGKTKSIQLKLSSPSGKEINEWLGADSKEKGKKHNLFISLNDGESSQQMLTKKWLREALHESNKTNEWFQKLLKWLPKSKREKVAVIK